MAQVEFRENPTFSNLRGNIKDIGNVMLQKQLKDQEEKKQIQQVIQKALLESALKNQQLKPGADLSTLDTSQGMGSILGQIPKVFEQDPMTKLEETGKIADIENKIYAAGGPAPSRTPKATILGGEQPTSSNIIADASNLEPKDLDQFGRPTGFQEKKGLSIETGGKLAMVKQAKNDIEEVRQMLFPDGTPNSFKRGLATASNLPGSRAPLIGAIVPQALPFHEGGQKVYSRLQNAVAAKLRVETGAQANPSEVENILARFGITGASSPEAAFDALKRLEGFMDETINITDPTGKFSGKAKSQNSDPLGIR